ncbi:MAG: hypothetical protein IH840_18180 [Candidatus Heimdallarchaeota archaeon]|nr:hypothetical protein [Candidatus Heimdallarchaeota archaeon]
MKTHKSLLQAGYRQCKVFPRYTEWLRPDNVYELLEWIRTPVEIIVGREDSFFAKDSLAAWESILPRSELTVTIVSKWSHYPYLEQPQEFANYFNHLKNSSESINAHTKAGRLTLAEFAGISVPMKFVVDGSSENFNHLILDETKTYMVRSSSFSEDKIDQSNAGKYPTFLRVNPDEVPNRVISLLEDEIDEVIVQVFIEPIYSGVAFVRSLGGYCEWVDGHLETLVDGTTSPASFSWSKIGKKYMYPSSSKGLTKWQKSLISFVNNVIAKFHYTASDIEWAFDGLFHLLQIRPITRFQWNRVLSSGNLEELLPQKVSFFMENSQRMATLSISHIFAAWDTSVLEMREPFTSQYDDASYINGDLILGLFRKWGLSSKFITKEFGSLLPRIRFNPLKFIKHLPTFLRMHFVTRSRVMKIEDELLSFDRDLKEYENKSAAFQVENWFLRYYLFIVKSNLIINTMLGSAGGSMLGKPSTVYKDVKSSVHRLQFESDPVTPRNKGELTSLDPYPFQNKFLRFWHKLGGFGLRGHYIAIREWFRDSNMKLFYRLHFLLQRHELLIDHGGTRHKSGLFMEHTGLSVASKSDIILLYPGKVIGVIGQDLLIVETLQSHDFERFKQYKVIISKTGGKLSHGATLVRELKIPSAIIFGFEAETGSRFEFENGKIKLF